MLTSKEVLDQTGISRATLNNYIALRVVARPQVLPPTAGDGSAPRIGYFPDEVIVRIREIQALKKQGWSMARIAGHLGGAPPSAAARQAPPGATPSHPTAHPPVHPPAGPPALPPAHTPAHPPGRPVAAAPVLTHVAVLAAQLQDAARLWSELPPEEYFELVNQIGFRADPILRRHHGVYGRHPGEGLLSYFFPRPESSHLWDGLCAAHEIRDAMRDVSKEWQLRKRWSTELHLNIGIDEGREWLGTVALGQQIEQRVMGEAVIRATQLSTFAHAGAVWVTRNLMGQLHEAERARLKYGVHRLGSDGQEVFVSSIFSRVDHLADPKAQRAEPPGAVGRLPVTEIVDIYNKAVTP